MTLLPNLSDEESKQLSECYFNYHPDAKAWAPGRKGSPHLSVWARMDVQDVYYTGGFGE